MIGNIGNFIYYFFLVVNELEVQFLEIDCYVEINLGMLLVMILDSLYIQFILVFFGFLGSFFIDKNGSRMGVDWEMVGIDVVYG